MVEPEKPLKKKDQILIDEEIAQRLQEGIAREQKKRKAGRQKEELFDKAMTRVNMFMDMDTELVKESSKKVEMEQESSSKRVGEELESDNSKKQKLDESVEVEVDDEAEMKKHMEIVFDNKNIDREDLETHWKLVKAKHGNTRPDEAYERVLWGDLKLMFELLIRKVINCICYDWFREKYQLYTCNNHINAQTRAFKLNPWYEMAINFLSHDKHVKNLEVLNASLVKD
ncbi:hypothetical protein Tco_0779786 [Tanacetum coccineum]